MTMQLKEHRLALENVAREEAKLKSLHHRINWMQHTHITHTPLPADMKAIKSLLSRTRQSPGSLEKVDHRMISLNPTLEKSMPEREILLTNDI